jgi:hypothetical protein
MLPLAEVLAALAVVPLTVRRMARQVPERPDRETAAAFPAHGEPATSFQLAAAAAQEQQAATA